MGKQDTEWKIIIKNEDDLFADKHKPGKIAKIFRGVFVCIFIAVAVFVGYKMLSNKDADTFESYIKNDKYEEAKDCYDYDKDYDVLVDEIVYRRMEYEKTKDKDIFVRMWKLIFQFESSIRVADKAFYEDLKYFPKEKKVVRVGYDKDIASHMSYMEDYYESEILNNIYNDNELYSYYIDVELVLVDDTVDMDEDVDVVITNTGYDVINDTEAHVKKFVDIIINEYIGEDGEDEIYY